MRLRLCIFKTSTGQILTSTGKFSEKKVNFLNLNGLLGLLRLYSSSLCASLSPHLLPKAILGFCSCNKALKRCD